jgi:quinoprotein glucose dehydrogenase
LSRPWLEPGLLRRNPRITRLPIGLFTAATGGSRYSLLTQIDKNNVAQLEIAWEYHTGDVSDGSDGRRKSEFEATPIVADGTMYLSTPFNRVVALDPETGREK